MARTHGAESPRPLPEHRPVRSERRRRNCTCDRCLEPWVPLSWAGKPTSLLSRVCWTQTGQSPMRRREDFSRLSSISSRRREPGPLPERLPARRALDCQDCAVNDKHAARGQIIMSIRPAKRIIESKPTIEGAGVKLRRAFGFGDTGEFDPFLLLDDFRNDRPENYRAGFPWHPPRGIETITHVLAAARGP